MRAVTLKKQVGLIALIILVVNVFSYFTYLRIDFTSDGRFTLSGLSNTIVNSINDPMKVTVYLKGDLNGEFRRLQRETSFLLEELHLENRKIIKVMTDARRAYLRSSASICSYISCVNMQFVR